MESALENRLAGPPPTPRFELTLAEDARAAQDFLAATARALDRAGASDRTVAASLRVVMREAREAFFRRHAPAMYEALTRNCSLASRVSELVYAAAEHFPGLLPTREQIAAERSLMRQIAKEG